MDKQQKEPGLREAIGCLAVAVIAPTVVFGSIGLAFAAVIAPVASLLRWLFS